MSRKKTREKGVGEGKKGRREGKSVSSQPGKKK